MTFLAYNKVNASAAATRWAMREWKLVQTDKCDQVAACLHLRDVAFLLYGTYSHE